MIVKNEAHIIERCLRSAMPMFNRWCIVDTGSSDGTQQVVSKILQGIPGELHERPWKDFGYNRTEAIELASKLADYLFFLDADDVVEVPDGFHLPPLTADAYDLQMELSGTEFFRTGLVSTKLKWRSVGVLHEYLDADGPFTKETLLGPRILPIGDGGRSQGLSVQQKYKRDAETLEKALKDEPYNVRYVFYLAQSYRDAGMPEQALRTYQRRASMGGWDEEVWYSLLQVALLSEQTSVVPSTIAARYLAAYEKRPRRAEPLVHLARFHRVREEFAIAHLYAERALKIPKPDDLLFLDMSCYAWRAKDEFSIAAYYVGAYEESKRACEELLASDALPESERERVKENLRFAEEALGKVNWA